jgi:4-amino-4-deoxy-L-arabinose transferase
LLSSLQKRIALVLLCGCALYFLYFFGLTRVGMLGPDEPRYAAIGRDMAQSGDWITPRLWGHPWFEKPALLYWMTAAAFQSGLGMDLAPRLPVAILSAAFLIYFFVMMRREFGERAAVVASIVLATSAGWLAYSHVALPDLPMSVAFAAAMLLVMSGRGAILAGALLGLAVLAKGLAPLALFLPAVWFWRKHPRDLCILFLFTVAIAAPWYVLVTQRNGSAFIDEFFWKHHFGRYVTGALAHGQPFWFYVPVLVGGFFPWSPLLLLLFSRKLYQDDRARFLLVWFAWGFVFFSVSRNKLPGYLLPLLPAIAALIGAAIVEAPSKRAKLTILIATCALLLGLVPTIEGLLPQALLSGISRASIHFSPGWLLPAIGVALACVAIEWHGRRIAAVTAIAVLTTLWVCRMLAIEYPVLDRSVSARGAFALDSVTCVSDSNRSLEYGLDYYAGRKLPDCN